MRLFYGAMGCALVLLLAGTGEVQANEPMASGRPVLLSLSVPADAEIWIEGMKTKQTGASRQFLSPPLEPNKRYVYTLRMRSGGKEETKQVFVRGGERVNLNYTGQGEEVTRTFYFSPVSAAANSMSNGPAFALEDQIFDRHKPDFSDPFLYSGQ